MIEKRDNLLGAWAIHCDTADCHIEVLSIDEPEVTELAKSEGWDLKGTTHICPDCAAGSSPADVIKAEATAMQQAPPPALPEGVPPALAQAFKDSMGKARTSKEVFVPFDERSGATIPDVVAKAEDVETPEEQINRENRAKRVRERLEKDRALSKEKTLAKMGGVTDMLNDFDGMFGSSKTTWDD
jgi:hypothetical protein